MIPTRHAITRGASPVARPRRLSRVASFVLLPFVLVSGAACAPEGGSQVDARQAFSDPRVAELATAAVAGDAERVRALAHAGVDLDAHGDKQVTPLQWALFSRSTRGMETLLDAGADPAEPGIDGDTAVHLAAMADDPRYLTLLLARGADPNARNGVTEAPPLFSALRGGRDAQFDALLAAGAHPHATDRVGNTALHQAAKYNDARSALALLQAGTDPEARNAQGVTFQRYLFRTPDRVLSVEARNGRDAIRDWLRAHHVPIEDPDAR